MSDSKDILSRIQEFMKHSYRTFVHIGFSLSARVIRALLVIFIFCSIALNQTTLHAAPALTERETRAAVSCETSPFGARLPLVADAEVLIPFLDGGRVWEPNSTPIVVGINGASDRLLVDLEGDGQSEAVYAIPRSDGTVTLEVYGGDETGQPILRDTWNSGTSLSTDSKFSARLFAGNLNKGIPGDELLLVTGIEVRFGLFSTFSPMRFYSLTGSLGDPIAHANGQSDRILTLGGASPALLQTALGDVNGDGEDEIVQIFFQDRDNVNVIVRKASTFEYLYSFNRPTGLIQLLIGNQQGDAREEIVLLTYRRLSQELTTPTTLSVFELEPNLKGQFPVEIPQHFPVVDEEKLSFASLIGDQKIFPTATLGNIDEDIYQEILILRSGNVDESSSLNVIDTQRPRQFLEFRTNFTGLLQISITAGPLVVTDSETGNGNRLADVIMAFQFIDKIRLVHASSQRGPQGDLTLTTVSEQDIPGTIALTFNLSLGGWNNDTVFAEYVGCRDVSERQVKILGWLPPHWRALQAEQEKESGFGKSISQSEAKERGQNYAISADVSGYVGAKGGVKVFGTGVEVQAKVTAGYNFETGAGRNTEDEISRSIETGMAQSSGGGLLYNVTADARCYIYKVPPEHPSVEGEIRLCQVNSAVHQADDVFTYMDRSTQNRPKTWASVYRDWSNLALFRDAAVRQSSTNENHNPQNAIDMKVIYRNKSAANVPMAQTLKEQSPWWQVDLGEERVLTEIRLWSRAYQKDIYVFVSDRPFSDADTPEFLLQRKSTVASFFHQGYADNVLNISLRQNAISPDNNANLPIAGRYVRVQLAGSGQLSLDEVQIFGPTHVEPDRYPTAIRDLSGSQQDGWHQIKLWNPNTNSVTDWMETRGDVNFDGTGDGIWSGVNFAGSGTLSWDMSTESAKTTTYFTSTTHTARVGAEVDLEVGPVVAGGAVEFAGGIGQEEASSTSWAKGFAIGGELTGLPSNVASDIQQQCGYQTQPYSYNIVEQSNSGYSHGMMVIDYIVPQVNRGQNNCAAPHSRSSDPPYVNDSDQDGRPNDVDMFPNDPGEWIDSDSDGLGDNADSDPYFAPEVSFRFSQAAFTVSEISDTATVTVNLATALNSDVSVRYQSRETTDRNSAVAKINESTLFSDYLPTDGVLTFPAGSTRQAFTVSILADDRAEFVETVALQLWDVNGSNSTILDSATLFIQDDTSIQFSQRGQGLNFGGDGDVVELDTISSIGKSSHTVEIWVKIPVPGTEGLVDGVRPGIMLGNTTDSLNPDGFWLGTLWDIWKDGTPRVFWAGGGTVAAEFVLNGKADLRDGNWHHLAFVRDRSQNHYSIYVDGRLDARHEGAGQDMNWEGNPDPPFNRAAPFLVGYDYVVRPQSNKAFFHGEMDELRIWNQALSQEEIQTLIRERSLGSFEGLLNYWSMNEGSGSFMYDAIGNNHGRLAPLGTTYTAPDWTNNRTTTPATRFVTDTLAIAEGVGMANIDVSLVSPAESDVLMTVQASAGSASSPEDFGSGSFSVSIPAGQTLGIVQIPIVPDDQVESSESFNLTLSSSEAVALSPNSMVVTIEDDDSTPLTVNVLSGEAIDVPEGLPTAIELRLNRRSISPVDIAVLVGGNATIGTDYEPVSTTVTIPAGAIRVYLAVPLLDDNEVEKAESLILTLASDQANVVPGTVTITIIDGDQERSNQLYLPNVIR